MVKESIETDVAKKSDLERVETELKGEIRISNRNIIISLGGLMISLFTLLMGFMVFIDTIKEKLVL